jgi:hypothetical protein
MWPVFAHGGRQIQRGCTNLELLQWSWQPPPPVQGGRHPLAPTRVVPTWVVPT